MGEVVAGALSITSRRKIVEAHTHEGRAVLTGRGEQLLRFLCAQCFWCKPV